MPAPKIEFNSILETFKDGLAQEQDVTHRFIIYQRLHVMIKIMRQHHFKLVLDEQVEEEAMFETHIDYLNRIGDDCNTLYLYEKN